MEGLVSLRFFEQVQTLIDVGINMYDNVHATVPHQVLLKNVNVMNLNSDFLIGEYLCGQNPAAVMKLHMPLTLWVAEGKYVFELFATKPKMYDAAFADDSISVFDFLKNLMEYVYPSDMLMTELIRQFPYVNMTLEQLLNPKTTLSGAFAANHLVLLYEHQRDKSMNPHVLPRGKNILTMLPPDYTMHNESIYLSLIDTYELEARTPVSKTVVVQSAQIIPAAAAANGLDQRQECLLGKLAVFNNTESLNDSETQSLNVYWFKKKTGRNMMPAFDHEEPIVASTELHPYALIFTVLQKTLGRRGIIEALNVDKKFEVKDVLSPPRVHSNDFVSYLYCHYETEKDMLIAQYSVLQILDLSNRDLKYVKRGEEKVFTGPSLASVMTSWFKSHILGTAKDFNIAIKTYNLANELIDPMEFAKARMSEPEEEAMEESSSSSSSNDKVLKRGREPESEAVDPPFNTGIRGQTVDAVAGKRPNTSQECPPALPITEVSANFRSTAGCTSQSSVFDIDNMPVDSTNSLNVLTDGLFLTFGGQSLSQ